MSQSCCIILLNLYEGIVLANWGQNQVSTAGETFETPPKSALSSRHHHKYLSSWADSSSLIHFHACTYLDPPHTHRSNPPSLLRGVRCQDCLDDFLELGCPHLCLISTTIKTQHTRINEKGIFGLSSRTPLTKTLYNHGTSVFLHIHEAPTLQKNQ